MLNGAFSTEREVSQRLVDPGKKGGEPGTRVMVPAGTLMVLSVADGQDRDSGDLATIVAGWPVASSDGCFRLDPAAILGATPRSFALRVQGQSMAKADIYDGDIVVGEFTPEARTGDIVVALIDGESTLKRLILREGKPYLAAENPNYSNLIPLSELVIQGVVHTVIRKVSRVCQDF